MSESKKREDLLRGPTIASLVLAASLLGTSCSEPDTGVDADATISVVSTSDSTTTSIAAEEDPFAAFGRAVPVDAAATIRTTPVWLINRSEESMVVIAMAGASPVVVDTVPAADSVLVRIETRADSVELSASSRGGAPMGRTALSMDAEPKRVAFPR